MVEQADRFIKLMERIQAMSLGRPKPEEMNVDLSLPQMALLGHVMRHPSSHLQALAEAIGITPPSASVGVRKLEDAGWLERKPDPDDKRATRIYPTKKTQKMHQAFEYFQKESMSRFLAGLTYQEQVQMLDLFEKAVAAAETSVQSEITETHS